jgi:hypothetical protein
MNDGGADHGRVAGILAAIIEPTGHPRSMSRTLLSAVRRGAVLHPIAALGTSLERRTKCAKSPMVAIQHVHFKGRDRLRTAYYQTDATLRGLV